MKGKKSLFREYAETLIYAFIIAMAVRTFVIQAFKIPTGSMEPTLHGDPRHGDKIFVNKFIYRFKQPKRGDIVVFVTKNIPGLDGRKDFIKRLIGLPHDTVEIKNNSIYINRKTAEYSKIAQNIYFNSSPGIVPIKLRKKFKIPRFFFLAWSKAQENFYLLSSIVYKLPAKTRPGDVFTFDPRYIEYMQNTVPFKTQIVAFEGQIVEFRKDGIYVDKTRFTGDYRLNQMYAILGQYGMKGQKIKIPTDAYFVCGDNSANSKDSRYWGFVPKADLRGKAMFIWWPPKRWQILR